MKDKRWREERQWLYNLSMYGGKQNIVMMNGANKEKFKLHTPPAPYYRSRPIINRLRPIVRTEVSKLTSQKPSAFAVPSSSEDHDLFAANAAEQIWDSLYESKKIHRVLRRAVWWASITGNGFMKTWWDEDVTDPENDTTGDICYAPITPFHIFVADETETELEDQPYIVHATTRSLEEIELCYGVKIALPDANAELLDESFLMAMGLTSDVKKKDQVLLLECWVKPNKTKILPQGGLVTIAGDSILSYTEGWPYAHGKYPFIHIPHIDTGKFYRESTITDLIPLQREYNRTRGQIIESKNKMAKPQLAAELGSLDVSAITSEPGQVILYRPGFSPPTPIPLQGLPAYVLQELDRILTDMEDISGQHENPPGVTAATAINYLQEQDDTLLYGTFASIEEAMEKVAKLTLWYVKQYWDVPHMVKIAGTDESFDVQSFVGSDLRNNTDIRMESGSSLPTSRAAKQAFIMDLMKMGFLPPETGLEVMDIGGINKIYEQIQIDKRQAMRENLRMSQATMDLIMANDQVQLMKLQQDPTFMQKMNDNQIMQSPTGDLLDISAVARGGAPQSINPPLLVPVNSWDNHRAHIDKHNEFRKSQGFEVLSDDVKNLFEQHVQAHVSAIMVGAQGAMGLPPGTLDMASNPETVTELENNQTAPAPQPDSNSQAQGTDPNDPSTQPA
jgi:hypothetical protein